MMSRKKTVFSILGMAVILLLNACGPSQDELDATATQNAVAEFTKQTAEAQQLRPFPRVPQHLPTP